MDLGKKGIPVNSVCPSLMRSGMTADMMDDEDLLSNSPSGFLCVPKTPSGFIG
jgi:meso-butanediol dehydrogenase/(S,S)-butanediol dehydrogenase/diacetyl reductase